MAVEITNELLNYKESVEEEVKKISEDFDLSQRDAFVEWCFDRLKNYGLVPEPINVGFSYNSSKGNIGIDGYCYDESDDSYSFFIIDYSENENDNRLTSEIINENLNKVGRFIRRALDDALAQLENIDPSVVRVGKKIKYELTKEGTSTDVLRIKYFVLSNRFFRARTTPIVNDSKYCRQSIAYIIWGLDKFFSTDSSGKQRDTICVNFENGLQYIKADLPFADKYESYLCIISGKELADIYRNYGSALLEQNVRSYLGANTKINKNMIATIKTNPTEFFIYNNGISVTGSKVQISNGLITSIDDMQIINGGQTTASIYTAITRKYSDLDKIYVQMKLTIVKDDSDYDDMVNNISRFSNSQTAVRPGDLFASHPFHVKFEQLSKSVVAPAKEGEYAGTYWYYERSRGKYKQETFNLNDSRKNIYYSKFPKEQVIKKEELAKYYLALNMDPCTVAKGSAKCMSTFGELADNMFKADEDHSKINQDFFKRCVTYAIIFRDFDKNVYKASWYLKNSAKNVIVPYAIAKVLSSIPKDQSIDYSLIWNKQKVYDSLMNTLMDAALLTKNYFEKIANNGLVTEIGKKEDTWKNFQKEKFILSNEFLKDLISKDLLDSATRAARYDDAENTLVKHINIICNHTQGFWYKMIGEAKKLYFNQKQIDFLTLGSKIKDTNPKYPTDSQFKAIWKVLEELKNNGVDVEESEGGILKISSSAVHKIDF